MNMEISWERIKTHRKRLDSLEIRGLAVVLFRGHEQWLEEKLCKRDDEALAIEFLCLLGADGSTKAVDVLLGLLENGDDIQQAASAEALKDCPFILTIEPLRRLLLQQGRNSIKAGEVILSYGAKGAEVLYSLWRQVTKPDQKAQILALIAESGDQRAESLAFLAFMEDDDKLTDAALGAVERLGAKDLWGNVCACMQKENWRLRAKAARILGQWAIPATLPFLVALGEDPDPWVDGEKNKAISFIKCQQA